MPQMARLGPRGRRTSSVRCRQEAPRGSGAGGECDGRSVILTWRVRTGSPSSSLRISSEQPSGSIRCSSHPIPPWNRARRRRFTAEYKLQILRQADACSKPGEIGVLLRREGLYSSLLTEWRRQRERGSLQALDRPRGRPKADPREAQIAALQRRLERAERELEKARRVIEVQGNVSALLGDLLEPRGAQGSTER